MNAENRFRRDSSSSEQLIWNKATFTLRTQIYKLIPIIQTPPQLLTRWLDVGTLVDEFVVRESRACTSLCV
jgi:hypothetical protein